MKARRLGNALLVLVMLAACGSPKPSETFFTQDKAWTGAVPADADTVSPDEFKRGIDSGEFVLVSDATLEAQTAAREQGYQNDKTLLQGVPDKTPELQALLAEAATVPHFEGDRPATLPDGQTVVLFGLGTQLDNAAAAYKRAQDVTNALADYSLSYSLLPDDLKNQLPTPDSLAGQPLAAIRAALDKLNDLLGTAPASLGAARLEPGGSAWPQAINPGNGTDNNGVCTPTNLVARYWFPLKNFTSPVKNQARRGTCWAFAAIGALESRERVQNNNPADLSEQFLVNKVKQDWDSNDYADGYWSERALETAVDKNQLFPSESSWSYNGATSRPSVKDGDSDSYANSCSGYTGTCSDTAHESRRVCTTFIFTFCGYARVTFGGPGVASSRTIQVWRNGDGFDLNRYRLLLAQGYVLMASFPVYKGFMNDVGGDGVLSNYSQTKLDDKGKEVNGSYGGHAVQIVGFLSNDDLATFGNPANIGGGGYFIVKNSWGCFAGDGGYYYVPADYVSRLFNTLSVLDFDGRRSDAWKREQAAPGGSEAPKIEVKTNPARVDLRIETDLAPFFKVSHPVAKSVTLSVTSDKDGSLYNGPWSTDQALFGSSLKHTFTTQGTRTLSLLAQYGDSQARATFSVNVVNTAPTLTLSYSGDPHQGEPYALTSLITDINEPDADTLCANTAWSLDAPDLLASPSGCVQKVTFGTTGSRQIRVSTQDSEGATAQQTLNLNVLPPPENPYPRITSYGVYSREYSYLFGKIAGCGDEAVGSGGTIDLREQGCSFTRVPPQRYSAQVAVENPSGEALTYDWQLYVSNQAGESVLSGETGSSSSSFALASYRNAGPVTNDCRVTVTVNAPEPSRSKSLTLWTGKCTYNAYQIN